MEGKHVGDEGRTSNLLICGLPTKGVNSPRICTHNQLPKGVVTSRVLDYEVYNVSYVRQRNDGSSYASLPYVGYTYTALWTPWGSA